MSKRTQKTNSMNFFSTIRLRGLTLKNRIVVSPMQQYSATEGIPGDWHLVHLGSRAIGGAGLLLAECNPKERMLPLAVSEGGWQLKSSSATMINEPVQANAIITDGLADLILIAREHLRDPYFSLHAAKILGEEIAIPWQYQRAF
jgi:2,4-dienoyl-CoA reductase-like NADH-dependent reductase (Old Yellow Enzyme family)